MDKTFLLGVGAQKTGTTWLYTYLMNHPDASFHFGKEYHVLDSLYVPAMAGFLTSAREEVARNDRLPAEMGARRKLTFLRSRIRFCENPATYLDHFARMAEGKPGVRVVGDITPSYATLPEEAYRWVKTGMAERGLRTRALYMMRDPVERIISAFRSARGRGTRTNVLVNSADLERSFRAPDAEIRTRYETTIKTLQSVFDASDVIFLFYEELFREETIRTFCHRLGISESPAAFDKVMNGSAVDVEVDIDMRARIARHYRDTYAFMAERFGAARMESLWKGYALLD
jgi:hypothetical protein